MVGVPAMSRPLMLVVCYLLLLGCTYGGQVEGGTDRDYSTDSQGSESTTHRSRQAVIKAFEKNLLNMFGLKEKPKPSRKIHLPQYMLDLYNAQTDSPISGLDIDVRGKSSSTANIVRSFHHQEHEDDYATSQEDSRPHGGHTHRLAFNVSAIADNEVLTAAELRLFWKNHHSVSKRDLTDRDQRNSSLEQSYKHRVNVYQILKRLASNDVIRRLIDTKVVDIRNTSWQSFDVRPAIKDWRRSHRPNHGIEVEVLDHRGRPISMHRNLRIARSVSEHVDSSEDETRWFQERPLIVTYTDDGRQKRSTITRRTSRQRSSKRKRKLKPNCRRHPLYVDFTDVGWNSWIVAPAGYQAYYCQGECPFPLVDHLNATNHAIVQTLVNSASPQLAPKACCVPTDLSAISMLYLDDSDSVILRNYQDMVVEGCGCR